jgi:hypothetical protein
VIDSFPITGRIVVHAAPIDESMSLLCNKPNYESPFLIWIDNNLRVIVKWVDDRHSNCKGTVSLQGNLHGRGIFSRQVIERVHSGFDYGII